jgi:transaldolase
MRIFVDSAIVKDIRQVFRWKIADGVTTNPSLMKKAVDAGAAKDLKAYIKQILKSAGKTPVSLEVTETTASGMVKQGRAIYKLFKPFGNVYVKVPVNPAFRAGDSNQLDGLKAIRALVREGIPINCTLIFTPEQAYLAAKAGASFVSPFAGRVDDYLRGKAGQSFQKTDYYPAQGAIQKGKIRKAEVVHDAGIVSGVHLVKACVDIMKKYRFKTKVLAASLRNPLQIAEVEAVGAHLATIPFAAIVAMRENPALLPVLHFPKLKLRRNNAPKMLQHPKTFEGMKKFTDDIVEEYVTLTQ